MPKTPSITVPIIPKWQPWQCPNCKAWIAGWVPEHRCPKPKGYGHE